jgi:hypothetical protein
VGGGQVGTGVSDQRDERITTFWSAWPICVCLFCRHWLNLCRMAVKDWEERMKRSPNMFAMWHRVKSQIRFNHITFEGSRKQRKLFGADKTLP